MKYVLKQILQIMKKHTVALLVMLGACMLCMIESFFHPLVVQSLQIEGWCKKTIKQFVYCLLYFDCSYYSCPGFGSASGLVVA